MNDRTLLTLIDSRHCKRAFLDHPVERPLLEAVVRAAANAPSSKNTQSWQVAILTGAARHELSRRLCAAFDDDTSPRPDYANRSAQPDGLLKRREDAYGTAFFAHSKINRTDEQACRGHRRRNFLFFGAPVALIFHLPQNATPGNFLDMGCFMQNVMLGLLACEIGSCPQFSVASYSPVIHEFLGWKEKRCITAGMAVGRFDPHHPDNQFIPARAELSEYCQWHS